LLGTRKTVLGENAEQGSPQYFRDITQAMSEAKNPQSQAVARELRTATRDGQVEYWEVRAPINSQGKATGIKAREFDLAPRP
jgi:hypothetical protein